MKVKDNVFLKITRFEDAFTQMQKFAHPIDKSERIRVNEAFNRVLSRDVESPIDVPHFPRSSRDGYALVAADTFRAAEDKPVTLHLAGEVHVGSKPNIGLRRGECAKVSTGAMIPEGADSVAMIEHTEEDHETVKLYRPASPGENVIKIGTDLRAGQLVLKRGRKLTVFDSGVLSSLGLSEVEVYRKPKVAIISTGNELLGAGVRLEAGKVYDVNSVTIHQAVTASGGIPLDLGICRDDFARMADIVRSALVSSDVVLVSGGTSKGPGDLMPKVIQQLGKLDLYIHGVAMKPGKPTILSSIKGKLLIALPGYPTSSLIVYYALVDPLIRKMAREQPFELQRLKVYTATKVYSEIGRREFKPCRISKRDKGRILVKSMPTGSEAITTLANADGFMVIPENVEFLEENEEVELYLFPQRSEEIDCTEGGTQ
nr:molybdopterin-binding protein [Candidatus Njordarchaeum guaymaensis]